MRRREAFPCHLKLVCNTRMILTEMDWLKRPGTMGCCIKRGEHAGIKKTCKKWSLRAVKSPALPKLLHKRFTGIRWWNKGLIFIWQGSQSLARWSTPCSRPLSQNTTHTSTHLRLVWNHIQDGYCVSQFSYRTINTQCIISGRAGFRVTELEMTITPQITHQSESQHYL